jgi:hypothetical protein
MVARQTSDLEVEGSNPSLVSFFPVPNNKVLFLIDFRLCYIDPIEGMVEFILIF